MLTSMKSSPPTDVEYLETSEQESTRPVTRFVAPGYCIAFVAVTLAAYAQAYNAGPELVPRSSLTALALLCLLYIVFGTAGLYLAERRGSRFNIALLLLATAAIAAVTTIVSRGYTAMMLLGVVSACVLHLRAFHAALVTIAAVLVAQVGFALREPMWSALGQAQVSFASGMAFVFVFSRIAVREKEGRRANERLLQELSGATALLKAQAKEIEQMATMNERNRIAREIHDGLGHYLTVVHVQLEAALTFLSSDPERARAGLLKAQQLTHEGLNEVRRSVALLRGNVGSRPLIQALGALASECTEAGVPTHVRIEGAPRIVPEPLEFTLYRAAQEALTNARRHARASRIDVALCFRAAAVELSVCDDGVGAESCREGFGLLGLRERAELVGGHVSISSSPDRGFRLALEVPA